MYVVPALCFALAIVLFAASRTVSRDMQKLTDWYEQATVGAVGCRRTLLKRHRLVLLGRLVTGIDERHRLQIVLAR